MHCSARQTSIALHHFDRILRMARARFSTTDQASNGDYDYALHSDIAWHCPHVNERELLAHLLEVLNCEGETHGQHEEAQAIGEEVTLEPQQGRWLADAQGSAQAHLGRSLSRQLP